MHEIHAHTLCSVSTGGFEIGVSLQSYRLKYTKEHKWPDRKARECHISSFPATTSEIFGRLLETV